MEPPPDQTSAAISKSKDVKQILAAWETLSRPEARAADDAPLAGAKPTRTGTAKTRGARRFGVACQSFDIGVAVVTRVKLTGSLIGTVTIPQTGRNADYDVVDRELAQLGIKLSTATGIGYKGPRGPSKSWNYSIDVTHPVGMQLRDLGRPATQALTRRVIDVMAAAPSGPGEFW